MDTKHIRERLQYIQKTAHDDEAAHRNEDDLLWEFIEFISNEPTVPLRIRRMAKLVMKVADIKFSRWYA